jgi:CheY-like chemotaxis protein
MRTYRRIWRLAQAFEWVRPNSLPAGICGHSVRPLIKHHPLFVVASTEAPAHRAWKTAPVASTVVIIDDSEDFLDSAAGLLNEEGFEVVGCVADAAAAIEEVRRLRPAVVLLDIQLPTVGGFEIADALARIDPRPAVVLTSSRPAASYGEALHRAPVRGFIAKGELSGGSLAAMV